MAQDNREKFAYLDQLSTRQLEELLLADAEDPSGRDTSQVIFHILEVLQEREDGLKPEPVDVDRAWEEFQRYYLPSEQVLYPCEEDRPEPAKKPKARRVPIWRTLRVVAATVAVLFVFMVGAQASGWNVFGALAQWTSETFHFGASAHSENYDLFLEELGKNGIPKEYAPTWFPSGFIASEPVTKISDSTTSIQISFSDSEENLFCVSIDRYNSQLKLENGAFEKDNISADPYLSNGKPFYIFSNENFIMATWADEALSESIWGNLSLDDLKAIIDSIGGS